jgi:hypothetical protein
VDKYGKDMLWTRLSLYKPDAKREETAYSALGMHVVEQDNKKTEALSNHEKHSQETIGRSIR